MALKALLESLDGLDASLHEHYKEQTGPNGKKEYVLDLDGPTDALPAVKAVKTEAASTRTKLRDVETKYSKLKGFEGMDHADVVSKLDRIPELEAAAEGKLDENKINALVETRIKTKLAPIERERDTLKSKVGELEGEIGNFKTEKRVRTISDAVRQAAGKEKMLSEAIEDAIMLGERQLEISDEGVVNVKDSGLDVVTWINDLKAKRPHWWGPSEGGGAKGGKGGGFSGANPWSYEHWNMTEQAKIYSQDSAKADKMAKAAGTTVGGRKPAAKK